VQFTADLTSNLALVAKTNEEDCSEENDPSLAENEEDLDSYDWSE